jgi:hypothetical protein
VTFTAAFAATVGVPEMSPVEALILRPAGKPVADHANGAVPPVAVIAWLTATLRPLYSVPGLVTAGADAAHAGDAVTNPASVIATVKKTKRVLPPVMLDLSRKKG